MKSSYTAEQIKVLEGLDPVRKRPGMYIGSTDQKGMHHLLKEIVDNSVDEAIAGFAKNVWVVIHPDGRATVVDDGRGIPVEVQKKFGVSALELAMTKLHAGGKFDDRVYQASGGLHGVGASAVNALSQEMTVVVKRSKNYFIQSYRAGKPTEKVKEIASDRIVKLFPEAVGFSAISTQDSGTITTFFPDESIFKSGINWDMETIMTFLRERAYLLAGLFVHFRQLNSGIEKHFYFEGGIKSLVAHLNFHKKPLHEVIYCTGEYREAGFPVGVEAAIQYNESFSENLQSFANVINTPDGGAHVTGFRMALSKAIKDYAVKNGLLKEDKNGITGEDLREGLTAVVFVKMSTSQIQFESQTKAKLNNIEAQSAVYQVLKSKLDEYFEEHPAEARRIVEKVLLSARARLAARAAKDAVIRKGALEGSGLPGKLADCQSKLPEESELFIVEGDSAGGCFSADTKVALADGRNLSFKEITAEIQAGKQNYCYTIKKDGTVGLAPIMNPRLTKKNAQLIKIILDNKAEIVCTPDHKFMLRNGSYRQAGDLTPNDSLMPLRKKLSHIDNRITIDGYEMVLDPNKHRWIFTHLLADKYNLDRAVYRESDGAHRHHVDFNKLNNNPTNIKRLSQEEHLVLHKKILEVTLHRPDVKKKVARLHKTPEFRDKIRQAMTTAAMRKMLSDRAKIQWQDDSYKQFMTKKFLEFYRTDSAYREKNLRRLNEAQKRYWSDSENRTKRAELVEEFFQSHPERRQQLRDTAIRQWSDAALRKWRSQKTAEQWTDEFRIKRKTAYDKTYLNKALSALHDIYSKSGIVDKSKYQSRRRETNDKSLIRYETICERFFNGSEEALSQAVVNYNHKIKKIIFLDEGADVYDMEVPGTHNFALAAGIFVHNSAKMGRDRKFQAILPMWGKILNTERARLDKIIAYQALKDLLIALGTGIGETFDIKKLRYHRIILMADADVDGEHITTLNLTFFYRHLPEIIQSGYLYVAQPPLYKIQHKGKTQYVYSDEDRDRTVSSIKAAPGEAKITIQRFKGLGEMNAIQLWETTMNPQNRILKQVMVEDAAKADLTFETLMGPEVPPRKKFIQTHAKLATLDI
jgi:DNA gyrase subunit B